MGNAWLNGGHTTCSRTGFSIRSGLSSVLPGLVQGGCPVVCPVCAAGDAARGRAARDAPCGGTIPAVSLCALSVLLQPMRTCSECCELQTWCLVPWVGGHPEGPKAWDGAGDCFPHPQSVLVGVQPCPSSFTAQAASSPACSLQLVFYEHCNLKHFQHVLENKGLWGFPCKALHKRPGCESGSAGVAVGAARGHVGTASCWAEGRGLQTAGVQLHLHGAVHGSALQNGASETMPFIFAVRTNVWIVSWPGLSSARR